MESVMMPACVRPADSSVLREQLKREITWPRRLTAWPRSENHVILTQEGKDVAAIIHIE
ncbi:MAG: hypothetical protein AB4352_20745 [Hormoscilla sp.]